MYLSLSLSLSRSLSLSLSLSLPASLNNNCSLVGGKADAAALKSRNGGVATAASLRAPLAPPRGLPSDHEGAFACAFALGFQETFQAAFCDNAPLPFMVLSSRQRPLPIHLFPWMASSHYPFEVNR